MNTTHTPGLTETQRNFLRHLSRYTRPVSRSEMHSLAWRHEDRARQGCKRAGYAEFVGGKMDDGNTYPMGWRITDAGRAALARAESRS